MKLTTTNKIPEIPKKNACGDEKPVIFLFGLMPNVGDPEMPWEPIRLAISPCYAKCYTL